MIIVCVLLALLLILLLLPLGGVALYQDAGFSAWVKVGFVRVRVFPQKEKAAKETTADPTKEDTEKKGGKLELVQAALPLIKPALAGVKRRVTIRDLELFVTWAAADPADAAIGYGYANSALGMLWALLDTNFKVKKSRLGCQVDFNATDPTVYFKAILTTNLWRILTLALPLLIRFYRNYKALQPEKTKNEV